MMPCRIQSRISIHISAHPLGWMVLSSIQSWSVEGWEGWLQRELRGSLKELGGPQIELMGRWALWSLRGRDGHTCMIGEQSGR